MAKSNERPIAVLHIEDLGKISDFILKVRSVNLNIKNNVGFFATPVPAFATVSTDVGNLEDAEAIASTHVTGSAGARDIKYEIVLDDIHNLLGYVQKLADAAPDVDTAVAIINASGFGLKLHGVHVKPPLAAKRTGITGEIKLTAKAAGKRASYDWQKSTNGTTWEDLPSTLKASTTATGLTVDVRTYFRFRAILPDGTTAWSGAVSLVVE